jgi:topoisomerase-4 subunit A
MLMRKVNISGTFDADDKILVAYSDGNYEITDQELTQKLDAEKVLLIEKVRS